jgi:hypothetical protein
MSGVQNALSEYLNRTTYMSNPYSIGPPLSTYTPSPALSVPPIQNCGGYNFVGPNNSLGVGLGAPYGIGVGAPALGVASAFLPSITSGQGNLSLGMPGLSLSTTSGQQYQSVGVPNVMGNGLNAPSAQPIQKTTTTVKNTNVIGIPSSSSSLNLKKATGDNCQTVCEQQQYSDDTTTNDQCNTCPQQYTNGQQQSYQTQQQAFQSAVQNIVDNSVPLPSLAVAPGVSVGGVGGIALTTPAFLTGTPNVNVASGIAFANECGINYGLNSPLAVAGPIAPPITTLGSNYLSNLPNIPYYSGLNNSEPSAVINNANPAKPGYAMLARNWDGTAKVIVSKPDRFGCPQFEVFSPFEDHGSDCQCENCTAYCIDSCEYNCINGFGEPVPLLSSLVISSIGTISTAGIPENTFYFIIKPKLGSPIACRNSSGFAISVNGILNKNILMYKGCTYTCYFLLDESGFDASGVAAAKTLRLIFTRDPNGIDCSGSCVTDGTACTICTQELIDYDYLNKTGYPVGSVFKYTPGENTHPDCISTIYYQFINKSAGGGPITIL